MEDFVNPCEMCLFYREQGREYLQQIIRGDYGALVGLRTILDLAIDEERDSKIEALLQAHPDICSNGESNSHERFCIYEREMLQIMLDGVNLFVRNLKGASEEEQSLSLRTSWTRFKRE